METSETNKESFSSKTGSFSENKLRPMELEHQKLQLCAKHAVNNLLQLDSTKKDEQGREEDVFFVCHGKIWKISKQETFNPCSKKELDLIADEMTFKENELFKTDTFQDEDNDAKNYYSKLSYWQILRSSHRTPITGNYSYEVSFVIALNLLQALLVDIDICMSLLETIFSSFIHSKVLETALLKRNIEFEWFTEIDSLKTQSFCYNLDSGTVTVGFIVNSVEALSLTNAVTRLLSTPRHWFAITAIRHIQSGFLESISNWMDDEEVKSAPKWHLVDSEMNAIETLTSEELVHMLSEVLSNKGSIFRCILNGASSVN